MTNPKDEDQLLDHEYDGIQEYDNPMPRWWVWLFWGTFYFSLGYFIHYHMTGNGQSVADSYEADLALAREQEAMRAMGESLTEESLANLMTNEAMMADASSLFIQRCSQCHGNKGEGLIGPNLTDNYWLHGDATLMSIHQLVAEGVPARGMPAWQKQLRPIELGKIAAYVGTMRGTNVSGPKGPEGKLIEVAVTQPAPSNGSSTTPQ